MKYRPLPRTDLELSEVGFGVWTVATTWWGKIPEEQRAELLENAVELGVNFFDTADTYGEGYGEEILAKVLGYRRHDLVIATKFGYDFYDKLTPRVGHQERPQKFDQDFVRFACEQSLRRLNSDYIDLYQIHNPRIDALEKDDLFEVLEQLKTEGKIRYYGVALGPDIGWFEEGEASMKERDVHSLQIIYSILEQDPAKDFFPIAKDCEVGLLSRVPHASEALTGRYTEVPEFDESDHRSHRRIEWLRRLCGRWSRSNSWPARKRAAPWPRPPSSSPCTSPLSSRCCPTSPTWTNCATTPTPWTFPTSPMANRPSWTTCGSTTSIWKRPP